MANPEFSQQIVDYVRGSDPQRADQYAQAVAARDGGFLPEHLIPTINLLEKNYALKMLIEQPMGRTVILGNFFERQLNLEAMRLVKADIIADPKPYEDGLREFSHSKDEKVASVAKALLSLLPQIINTNF